MLLGRTVGGVSVFKMVDVYGLTGINRLTVVKHSRPAATRVARTLYVWPRCWISPAKMARPRTSRMFTMIEPRREVRTIMYCR